MKQQEQPSKLLDELFTEYKETDSNNKNLSPKRQRDSKDNFLGTLPPSLRKVWMMRERYYLHLEDIIDRGIDLIELLKLDMKDCEDGLSSFVKTDYGLKMYDLCAEFLPAYRVFHAINQTFSAVIELIYPTTQKMPVLGIRNGFGVHSREDDARNDSYDPFIALRRCLASSSNRSLGILLVKDPQDFTPGEIFNIVVGILMVFDEKK